MSVLQADKGRNGDAVTLQQQVEEPLQTFTLEELEDNPYADRAAVQDKANEQSQTEGAGDTTTGLTNPEVLDFGNGKAIANGTTTPDATTPDTGNKEQVTTPSNHVVDWGTTSFADAMKGAGKKVPVSQLIYDHLQWAHENGVMPDYLTINAIVNKSTDLSLSPEDDEKARKKAEHKEKFDKIGNFLLHLGNAIGNVGGGGYASMKLEDPVQWTERQRLLKEKAEKQRIANNQSIWSIMQKERAEQRAQEIAKQNAAHQAIMEKNAADRLELDRKRYEALMEQNKQRTENQAQHWQNQDQIAQQKAAAAANKNGGTGKKNGKKKKALPGATGTKPLPIGKK